MVSRSIAVAPVPSGHYRFSHVAQGEWAKLRSVRSTVWSLAFVVVAGIGIGVLVSATRAAHFRNGGLVDRLTFDLTAVSLAGLVLAHLAIGVLGVITMSAEYGTGSIRSTFSAVPRRPLVLAAKAAVFGAVALVVCEAVAFASFFISQALLSGSAPTASLSGPGVAQAVAGSGLYLTVLGLFALGIGAVVRHTAGGIAAFVGILLILPLIVAAFPASVGHPIGRYLPAVIGNAMMATTPQGAHADFLPAFSPWGGFALLCAYAAGALLLGALSMVRRDP
jgi:ABC-type transport system involved in multi-copper enzyme maturation permease subunit